MKMKLSDIGAINNAVLKVLHPRKIDDHMADVYGKVRDATVCNCNLSTAGCIAVLELVKAELIRDAQSQIDEG